MRDPRSPHLAALRGRSLWSLDIKEASLQADVFGRDVFIQFPPVWLPGDSRRVWKLNAPAYSMNNAPVAFHRPLKRYLSNGGAPRRLWIFGLKYPNSTPASSSCFAETVWLLASSPPVLMTFSGVVYQAFFGPVKVRFGPLDALWPCRGAGG